MKWRNRKKEVEFLTIEWGNMKSYFQFDGFDRGHEPVRAEFTLNLIFYRSLKIQIQIIIQ